MIYKQLNIGEKMITRKLSLFIAQFIMLFHITDQSNDEQLKDKNPLMVHDKNAEQIMFMNFITLK